MATEKVSVSLDSRLLAEARRRIHGRGTLSSYLNDALHRKVLAERHVEYLDFLDAEFGPVPMEKQEAAARRWNELERGT